MHDAGYFSTLRAFLVGRRRPRRRPQGRAAARINRCRITPFSLEPLEARVLLSADLASAVQVIDPAVATQQANTTVLLTAQENTGALGTAPKALGQFGNVPGHNGSADLLLSDTNGTLVTFSLIGAGLGEVSQVGNQWDIRLNGTDAQSTLTIWTNGGDGRTQLHDLHSAGSFGALTAPTTNLVGTLAVDGGLTKLALGNVQGGTISATAIGTMDIHGNLSQATVLIGAQLGQDGHPGGAGMDGDVYSVGTLGALHIRGSVIGSTVRIGQDPVDGLFDNGNDVIRGGSNSAIGSMRIDGMVSVDSRFVAGTFPATAQVAGVMVDSSFAFTRVSLEQIAAAPSTDGVPAMPSTPTDSAKDPVSVTPDPAPVDAPAPVTVITGPAIVTDQGSASASDIPVVSGQQVTAPLVTSPTQTSTTAISGKALDAALLSRWEQQMVTYGRKHTEALRTLSGLEAVQATYYDAERVYYQIAQYTGDNSWIDAAQGAERVYRDQYVQPGNGVVPGYWNFTRGLLMDYQRTGDVISKNAVILLSRNASYSTEITPLQWTVGVASSREVAYTIMGYLNAEAVGEPRRAKLGDLVTQAIGHLDQWFVSKTAPYLQPFMAGLTMQALIQYDAVVGGDPRILPAIKTAVDSLWANNWLPGSEAFQYVDRVVAGVGDPTPAPDLNMLIAPASAWIYAKTGDAAYQAKADAMFAGDVKYAYLDGAKQFNQSYMLAFDYLRWRNGQV
jgi:hypothetical protein